MWCRSVLAAGLLFAPAPLVVAQDDAEIMARAVAAWHEEDYQAARELMEPLARRGHAEALFRMGIIYERGLGVTIDMEIAEQFYNGYCPLPDDS